MRNLITILIITLSITLSAQSDMEFRSIGYITETASWNFDTQKFDKEPMEGVDLSFLVMKNSKIKVKLLRIYINAGHGESCNDYIINDEVEYSKEVGYQRYTLSQMFGSDIEITYDNKKFTIMSGLSIINGKLRYSQIINGNIVSHPAK